MSDDNETLNQDELTSLKARADQLGVTYHPSIGVDKLREKVAAALAGVKDKDPEPAKKEAPVVETEGQARKRLQQEALALVRVRVQCMNPAKKEWDGEIFTVGNSVIGSVKKYVPFNADEGWHVPKVIYDQLIARECQIFITEKVMTGMGMMSRRKGKQIREFAVEVLPPLTEEELHDLAQRQAMAGSVG